MTSNNIDVAIIGAGPYGLSIAAHLRRRNVAFRIFGTPMSSWRNHMPAGTFLKSFGFASNLYTPGDEFTLEKFCKERGLIYSRTADPVPLETFINYGMEFQKRFAPNLEETEIVYAERTPQGFALTTGSGELVQANRVIVAAGISHFDYTPEIFADFTKDLVTHSSQHTEVSQFKNKHVAVIGAGASAGDLAGLLHNVGADVHLIARSDAIDFHDPPIPEPRPISQRILKPESGLGHGVRGKLCTDFPLIFHSLPASMRLKAVHNVNGPAPGWFTKDKVVGKVTIHLGTSVNSARESNSKVSLQLSGRTQQSEMAFDHVIAATGYRVQINRLAFLSSDLMGQIKTYANAPILKKNFESSVPGLYMVGLASAPSFGPLCRFAYGAKFTSARIANHLARTV